MENGKLNPDRLKTVRTALGITAAEAARLIGLDKSTYHKYESGSASPSDPTLRIIALYLKTSPEYLCALSDNPTPNVLPVPVDDGTIDFVQDFATLTAEQRDVITKIIRLFKQGQKK